MTGTVETDSDEYYTADDEETSPNRMSVFSGEGRPSSDKCEFVVGGGSLPFQASLEAVHVLQGALALLDPSA